MRLPREMAAATTETTGASLLRRVRLQFFQRDEFECGSVRRFKIDRRGHAMIERFLPARYADTPFVARLESGKFPFRMWGYEIVSLQHGEIEKFARHLRANAVQAHVSRSGFAETIAIKPGDRVATATLQFRS